MPRRLRVRRSAFLSLEDPVTLETALDARVCSFFSIAQTLLSYTVFFSQGLPMARCINTSMMVSRETIRRENISTSVSISEQCRPVSVTKIRISTSSLLNRFFSSFSRLLHSASTYITRVWLERVQVVGFRSKPSSATVKDMTSGEVTSLEFSYDPKLQLLTPRKPGVSMASEWEIAIRP